MLTIFFRHIVEPFSIAHTRKTKLSNKIYKNNNAHYDIDTHYAMNEDGKIKCVRV